MSLRIFVLSGQPSGSNWQAATVSESVSEKGESPVENSGGLEWILIESPMKSAII